jgi:ribonuclease Z
MQQPRTFTNPTSQILEIKNRLFLIDWWRYTSTIAKNKIRFSKINHIFISHLHGDHFWVDRSSVYVYIIKSEYRFYIHGPKGIKEIIKLQLRLASWSNYGLHFHELESNESEIIFEDDKVVVRTIPLKHRIYTNGFLFEEK